MAAKESDAFMAELLEVHESKLGCASMIEDNVGDILNGLVPCYSDRRKFRLGVNRGINGNQTFDASGHQHTRIGVEQLGIVAMGYRKEEKSIFTQVRFDTADNQAAVRISDFFGNNADRVSALNTERTCQEVRAVVQDTCCFQNSFASMFRDRTSRGGIIQNCGY